MQEFIEMLIARLEERKKLYHRQYVDDCIGYTTYHRYEHELDKIISIVNQLAEEYNNSHDSMEIQIAKNYAKWLTKCGVNVTEKWLTATEQAYALDEAYIRGRQDERDRFAEWQEEHNNGWIPCSERLPEKRDWYLAVFQEVDTGFIGLPFIADYLMGKHTNYTTEDGWIIANCTDIEEDRAEYYKKLKCIAWKPIAPYQPKGE